MAWNMKIIVRKIESFLVQQFFKNAAEVTGEKPLSLPAGSEIPCATLPAHGEEGEKSDSFSRESEQDRSP
jgi:hypothetical protein